MGGERTVHELREQAHDLGIEGASSMGGGEVPAASEAGREGKLPEEAKHEGKQASR